MTEGVIPVLAAVIRRGERYLVGLRPRHKRHGGSWEFRGGTLLPGESWLEGARRELAEELAVDVQRPGDPICEVRDLGSPFSIAFVDVTITGEPTALDHSELRWADRVELEQLDLAPADRAFVAQLPI